VIEDDSLKGDDVTEESGSEGPSFYTPDSSSLTARASREES
jgi:hypothetical protein